MKYIQQVRHSSLVVTALLLLIFSSCDRSISDEAVPASFPANSAVFLDGFSGGLEYLPFQGSKLDAFTVDNQTFYAGSASMRFNVPNFGDPEGTFAGAIFPDYGGRDLSEFDALTFWAKASQAATINEIGFGNDFGDNKYLVTKNNLRVTTGWQKYIIPIPDPSLLTRENGLFWYSEGPDENGDGYTFWIDELQFENLGTIAQPRPSILNGEDREVQTFIGSEITITGTQTFNLPSGQNETVSVAPAYFRYQSSDTLVAEVDEVGVITVLSTGEAEVTAYLNGVKASGSITLESLGDFVGAPTPPQRAPGNVVSIFSDSYNNVPLNQENPYNGFFNGDGQTTLGGLVEIGGENIISYTDLNFVSINMFTAPDVNASAMTYIHVDVNVREAVDASDVLNFQIINDDDGSSSSGTVNLNSIVPLEEGIWISYDIPLNSFTGLAGTDDIDLIFFVSNSISAIYVDNVYFYTE